MRAPCVSTIVPVHDGARYLAEALESILAQAHRPLEVIVVDDGSSDASAEIAEGFGNPVRVLRRPHRDLPHPHNAGLESARGELLAFLDADDLWHPDKLAHQLAVLAQRPDLDLCFAQVQNFVSPELEGGDAIDPDLLQPMAVGSIQSMLARRSLVERVGNFDPSLRHAFGSDWLARARALGAQSIALPQVLTRRRLHDANRSQRWAARSQNEHLELVKAHLEQRRAAAQEES